MISSICAKLVMLCMAGLLGGFVWLLVCVFTKRKKKPCFVVCAACVGGFVVFTLIGSLTSPYANCDHDFQLVETQEADCEKSGKKIYRCPLCGMERKENIRARQAEGIAIAKAAGKYKGRKPVEIDWTAFEAVYAEVENGKRTSRSAMEQLGLKQNTYYRTVNEYKRRKENET